MLCKCGDVTEFFRGGDQLMGRMQMRRDAVNQRPDDARRNRIRHRGKRSKKTATTTTTTTATTTTISKRRRRRHVFGAGKNRKGVRSDPKFGGQKKNSFFFTFPPNIARWNSSLIGAVWYRELGISNAPTFRKRKKK